jgi:hypothetical protein
MFDFTEYDYLDEMRDAAVILEDLREQTLEVAKIVRDETLRDELLNDALDALVVINHIKSLLAEDISMEMTAYQILMNHSDIADKIIAAMMEEMGEQIK